MTRTSATAGSPVPRHAPSTRHRRCRRSCWPRAPRAAASRGSRPGRRRRAVRAPARPAARHARRAPGGAAGSPATSNSVPRTASGSAPTAPASAASKRCASGASTSRGSTGAFAHRARRLRTAATRSICGGGAGASTVAAAVCVSGVRGAASASEAGEFQRPSPRPAASLRLLGRPAHGRRQQPPAVLAGRPGSRWCRRRREGQRLGDQRLPRGEAHVEVEDVALLVALEKAIARRAEPMPDQPRTCSSVPVRSSSIRTAAVSAPRPRPPNRWTRRVSPRARRALPSSRGSRPTRASAARDPRACG